MVIYIYKRGPPEELRKEVEKVGYACVWIERVSAVFNGEKALWYWVCLKDTFPYPLPRQQNEEKVLSVEDDKFKS